MVAEVMDLEDFGVEPEQSEEGLAISRPFDPEKIKVKTVGRTIALLMKRLEHNEIDLAPEFQRRARIWDIGRKSRLIESLLLRIPLPVFYVAADSTDNWAVVDGLQRLTTIQDFFTGEFCLSGLEYLTQLNSRFFTTLPRPMQRRVEETELVIHVIEPGTPEEVMINIFKRINTGGVSLNGQEIRNALNKGPAREMLRRLAASEEFMRATDGSVNDARLDAQECVLRFLAFRLTDWQQYNSNDLDGFLNTATRSLNALADNDRIALGEDFTRAMAAAAGIFGRDAFRKRSSPDAKRNRVSKALFESWSVNLARRTNDELAALTTRRDQLMAAFSEMLTQDRLFEVSISYSTGSPQRVLKRFGAIQDLIDRVLE
jgi:hypothetical protein